MFTDTNLSRPSPSNESAETSNTSDIPSSRCLFRLRLSERPIDETESSSVLIGTVTTSTGGYRSERFRGQKTPNPLDMVHDFNTGKDMTFAGLQQTPTAVMTCESPEKMRARAERNGYKNGTKYGSLESQVNYDPRFSALLPTPTAIEGTKYTNTFNPDSQMGQSLSAMAGSGMLPTPQTSDCQEPLTPEQKQKYVEKWAKKGIVPSAAYQLRQQAVEGLLPTPTARDFKNPSSPDGERIARKKEQGWTIELRPAIRRL